MKFLTDFGNETQPKNHNAGGWWETIIWVSRALGPIVLSCLSKYPFFSPRTWNPPSFPGRASFQPIQCNRFNFIYQILPHYTLLTLKYGVKISTLYINHTNLHAYIPITTRTDTFVSEQEIICGSSMHVWDWVTR